MRSGRYLFTFFLIACSFSALLSACSQKSGSSGDNSPAAQPPAAPSPNAPSPAVPAPQRLGGEIRKIARGDKSNPKMKVVDASNLAKVVVDATDNPPNYAVNGKLLKVDATIHQLNNNAATICMARLLLFQPKDGDVLELSAINIGKTGRDNQLHFANLHHLTAAGGALYLVCSSKAGPVTYEGVQGALQGIIEITR